MSNAVFLDRDGVLIEEKHYLHRPEEVALILGAAPALKRLMDAGYLLFIVTNQSGVGRGYFTMEDVDKVHQRLESEFEKRGVRFRQIYIAPEAPDQPSRGRKPSPQFLFDARDTHGVDLSQSYMIGDKRIDLECGWNAGVKKSILVRTGYGIKTEKKDPQAIIKALVTDDLAGATDWILSQPH
jgi:D-glycero-D-manno-heptose 1,7-bisphosphate phosphatase